MASIWENGRLHRQGKASRLACDPPESRGARQVSSSCSRNRVFLPVNQLSDGRGHEASDRDGTWSSFFFKANQYTVIRRK